MGAHASAGRLSSIYFEGIFKNTQNSSFQAEKHENWNETFKQYHFDPKRRVHSEIDPFIFQKRNKSSLPVQKITLQSLLVEFYSLCN